MTQPIAGEPAPDKPPVLMIHGLTGTPAELLSVTRALRIAGHPVEAPMMAGHGVDEATLSRTGWRDWLGGMQDELIRLSADGPVFVGGLSMGAVLAMALAQGFPERVRGLALYAPTLRYDGFACPWFTPLLPALASTGLMRAYRFAERPPYGLKDERLRAVVSEMMLTRSSPDAGLAGTPGKSLADSIHLNRRVERRLEAVTAPALLVHPVEDDMTDIANSRRLAGRLGGPVRTLWLEDSYHLVTVDRQRNEVARATVGFFDDVLAGTPVTARALT